MQYCDMGTLRDAVKRGLFHVQISKNVIAVDLLKVIKVRDLRDLRDLRSSLI